MDLNANHRLVETLSQEELQAILVDSDKKYDEGQPFLLDDVYDYVKRVYNQRRLGTTDKTETLKSVSSPSGVGIVRQRDTKLPVALRSLDNMFYGEGDVEKWALNRCSYYVSAKMDGISGLYYKGELFTRGDALTGRNISHILPYLKTKLPDVPFYVRGELIMNRETFQAKFQGQKGRNNARNSVSGAVSAIHKIDTDFLSELEFIAYEIIPLTEDRPNASPGRQFAALEKVGFKTALGRAFATINDQVLSDYYAELLATYAYEIDGIVVARDEMYARESTKNPSYARAFKKALECLLAPSTVTAVEWNVSAYGYLIPTVLYEPVQICGVTLARATGESARYIVDQGLGPGATVEIIYHGKVNPRIHQVFQKASEPALPPANEWQWIPRDGGEPIHIRASGGSRDMLIQIQVLIRFMNDLNVKNVGPGLITQLYEAGFNTVEKLIKMRPEEIRFIGPKNSASIPEGIRLALQKATPEILMVCSGAFGRGIGEKKLAKLLEHYPDFLTRDYTLGELETVDGFAGKTAALVLQGKPGFLAFMKQNDLTVKQVKESSIPLPQSTPLNPLNGLKICFTGFRDAELQAYIENAGGTIQTGCTKCTSYLLVPDLGYTNKKTELAVKLGIPVLTREDFRTQYL
jgi:DNA ligase (NAD+)